MTTPDLKFALNLPPAEAIKWFESKGYAVTWNWEEQVGPAHNRAFTAAKAMTLDILQTVRDGVSKAIAEGQSERTFTQNLEPLLKQKGWWGRQTVEGPDGEEVVTLGSPYRLKTIYQTNMQSAMMAGRQKDFLENVGNRPYWQYVAVLDERTRPTHRALDGRVFRYDDPFWQSFTPPLGFNCFPEGQMVDCDPIGGSKAFYSGQIIKITTQSGNTLTVTANHPVLTEHGFIPACEVNESTNLVCTGRKGEGLGSGAVDNQQSPALVEDIFDSLSLHGTGLLEPCDLDLYGDGAAINSKIQVVGSESFLRGVEQSTGRKLLREQQLVSGLGQSGLPHFGPTDFHGLPTPTTQPQFFDDGCDMGFADSQSLGDCQISQPLKVELLDVRGKFSPSLLPQGSQGARNNSVLSQALLGRGGNSATPLEPFLLTLRSQLDTRLSENPIDDIPATSVELGKFVDSIPHDVFVDNVVRVVKSNYSGHIYDFTTTNGLIISNSVVTSNCRCRIRALSERDIQKRDLTVESSDGLLSERNKLLSIRSGIEVPVPVLKDPLGDISPDPGFGYNKLDMSWHPDLEKYDPQLAREHVKATLKGQPFLDFVEGRSEADYPVGILSPAQKVAQGTDKQTVYLRQQDLDPALTVEDYRKIPELLGSEDMSADVGGSLLRLLVSGVSRLFGRLLRG